MANYPNESPLIVYCGSNYSAGRECYAIRNFADRTNAEISQACKEADSKNLDLFADTCEMTATQKHNLGDWGYELLHHGVDSSVWVRNANKSGPRKCVIVTLNRSGMEICPPKTLDVRNSSDTKFLINHIVWAIHQGHTVSASAI